MKALVTRGRGVERTDGGARRALKDLFGDEFEAPITEFPNFEHLEAKGRREEKSECCAAGRENQSGCIRHSLGEARAARMKPFHEMTKKEVGDHLRSLYHAQPKADWDKLAVGNVILHKGYGWRIVSTSRPSAASSWRPTW